MTGLPEIVAASSGTSLVTVENITGFYTFGIFNSRTDADEFL